MCLLNRDGIWAFRLKQSDLLFRNVIVLVFKETHSLSLIFYNSSQ